MKGEDVRAGLIMCFAFVAGASATAYLVLSDPESRGLFRAKGQRIRDGSWRGLAEEVARTTVLELRAQFPKLLGGEG